MEIISHWATLRVRHNLYTSFLYYMHEPTRVQPVHGITRIHPYHTVSIIDHCNG